jgi:hypothetical protein
MHINLLIIYHVNNLFPVFLLLSGACTLFARLEAGIMGSNPTQGMDVLYVHMFILCLCCPVFR